MAKQRDGGGGGGEVDNYGAGDWGAGDYGIVGYYDDGGGMSPSPGETIVRVGYDGEITDESIVQGAIRTSGTRIAAIGQSGPNYLGEPLVEGAWFFDEPQSERRYERLYNGTNTPAMDLIAHYPFDETPEETTAFDTIGWWHGTKDGTRPAGWPVTLDSASHSLTTIVGDFNRGITYNKFLRTAKTNKIT